MKKKLINLKVLIIVLVTSLIIPLFFSCEDNDEDIIAYYDTYIDGYIKDYHTGEPVAGVVFDAKYFDESNGGLFGTSPYYATNIAVSNSQGYYKIKIPKHGDLGSIDASYDFIAIRIIPRATENYNFEFRSFDYKDDRVNVESKKIDIRPITYGYLKVILPKSSNQGWGFWNYPESCFETPYYKPKFIISESYNDSLNYFVFKVPVGTGTFRIGNDSWKPRDFTIDYPRDTTTLYVDIE